MAEQIGVRPPDPRRDRLERDRLRPRFEQQRARRLERGVARFLRGHPATGGESGGGHYAFPVGGFRRKIKASIPAPNRRPARSEEHTSEIQSLMRISYAV